MELWRDAMTDANEALARALCRSQSTMGPCPCDECHRSLDFERHAAALHAALAAQGYAVVPVEPTDCMLIEVLRQSDERYGSTYCAVGPLEWHYKAMIKAAQDQA